MSTKNHTGIDNVLLANHCHFLFDEIDYQNIKDVIKWIVYENTIKTTKPLTLYINSHGGSLNDAFALIDVMKHSRRIIRTVAIGSIFSSGFMIFVSGSKGHRYIAENTSILCHQFHQEIEGKYHELTSIYKEQSLTHQRMINLLANVSNIKKNDIQNLLLPPTDKWLKSNEMIAYELADHYYKELK